MLRVAALRRRAPRGLPALPPERHSADARLSAALFGLPGGDRRRHRRFTCRIEVELTIADRSFMTVLADLGAGGAMIPPLEPALSGGRRDALLRFAGGVAAVMIMTNRDGRAHLAFGTRRDPEFDAGVARHLATLAAETELALWRASEWAGRLETEIEVAIRAGALPEPFADGRPDRPTSEVDRAYAERIRRLAAAMTAGGQAQRYLLVSAGDGHRTTAAIIDPTEAARTALAARLAAEAGDIGAILAARWRPVAGSRTLWLDATPDGAIWYRETSVPLRLFGRRWGTLRLGFAPDAA